MRRLEKLVSRRIDDMIRAAPATEAYRSIKQSDAVRYAVGAMQPIAPDYTKHTIAQGERVRSQLQERVRENCTYEFQGSVTTDTHIKARSDIDLLSIIEAFVFLELPQRPAPPYAGDPVQDMHRLRKEIEGALIAAFPAATVDKSKGKCIRISGGSLTRQVDVVPSAWLNTNQYVETGSKIFRSLKVFDSNSAAFSTNNPWLHKSRVQERDEATRGGFRKAVRLLKTLMYDSDGRVGMSSYNIAGVAYAIPPDDLCAPAPRDLSVLEACFDTCSRLLVNDALRSGARVPDGRRPVFGADPGATIEQLRALTQEISDLRREILVENYAAFTKLNEAGLTYSV